jgi:hypothetical protein
MKRQFTNEESIRIKILDMSVPFLGNNKVSESLIKFNNVLNTVKAEHGVVNAIQCVINDIKNRPELQDDLTLAFIDMTENPSEESLKRMTDVVYKSVELLELYSSFKLGDMVYNIIEMNIIENKIIFIDRIRDNVNQFAGDIITAFGEYMAYYTNGSMVVSLHLMGQLIEELIYGIDNIEQLSIEELNELIQNDHDKLSTVLLYTLFSEMEHEVYFFSHDTINTAIYNSFMNMVGHISIENLSDFILEFVNEDNVYPDYYLSLFGLDDTIIEFMDTMVSSYNTDIHNINNAVEIIKIFISNIMSLIEKYMEIEEVKEDIPEAFVDLYDLTIDNNLKGPYIIENLCVNTMRRIIYNNMDVENMELYKAFIFAVDEATPESVEELIRVFKQTNEKNDKYLN